MNIPEGIPVLEFVRIVKATNHPLKNEELRVMHVRKNEVYNPQTLKKQINPYDFESLIKKLNKTKLMKFVTTEILWQNSIRRLSLSPMTHPSR